jgi:hypothetical protein
VINQKESPSRQDGQNSKTTNNDTSKIVPVKKQDIYDLLGLPVVLLPVPLKEKGCRKPNWQNTTWDQTQEPDWQQELLDGNISILTGKASNGIVAIDFDSDECLEKFFTLNPTFTKSTRTKGYRGAVIWIQVKGDYPAQHNFKIEDKVFAEWKSTRGQQNISGVHPKGIPYHFIVKEPPLEICFDEIVWPEPILLELQNDRLIEEQGNPFWGNEKRDDSLNLNFWAALYARENCLLYEPNEKQIYRYFEKNGLWFKQYQEVILTGISNMLLAESKIAGREFMERKRTLATLNGIFNLMQGIAAKPEVFKKNQNFVHVANGVITLNDDIQLEAFSPEFYSRNASPIPYIENAECPRFLNELLLPAVSKDDAEVIQKLGGLYLTGHNKIQRLLLLSGTAGRGKSALVSVIEKIIGVINVAELRTEHLNDRFELFGYQSKTLLAGKDVSGDFLMRKGAPVLKKLVGKDLLEVEGKNLNQRFHMVGDFNVVIICNSRLRIRLEGDLEAWKRRLIVIEIDAPPPERKIPGFDDILIKEEGSGILNFFLGGLMKLRQDIIEIGDIKLSEKQHGLIDGVLAESESARHFLIDCIERDRGNEASITIDELLSAYGDYCSDKKWNTLPETVFKRLLTDLMLQLFSAAKSHSIGGKRGFRGVRFKIVSQQ